MKLTNIILFAGAAFATGIWQANIYNYQLITLTLLAILLLLTSLWRMYSNSQRSFWPVIALFLVAGMLCYNQSVLLREDDISHYAGQTVTIEGTIAAVPELTTIDENSKRFRYTVKVEEIRAKGQETAVYVTGKIRLIIQSTDTKVNSAAYGDKISISGKLLELHNYNNPGQVDMNAALKRQGITARMNGQENSMKVFAKSKEFSYQTRLVTWQQQMIAALQKVMPVNDAAILTAVLFGGYQGINKNVINEFTATGLIHILSVSGAHIALVIGLVTWIGKRLRWDTFFTITLATVVVVFYTVMSGLTPPVIRSAIMGTMGLLAIILNREPYAPTALAVTGIAMLIYQPLLLFDISFQLSFAATAGLIFLYQKTLSYLSKLPYYLAGPLAVTLAAQLGVLPVIAWYFNNFSLISFVANIVVLPIIEVVIILGLAGVLIYTAVPAVGSVIFVTCSLLLGLVMLLTKLLTAVPYSSVYIPAMNISVSVVYYLGLAWVYGWRPFQLPGPKQLVAKYPRTCLCAIVVIIGSLLVFAWYPKPLTVHFIDVGQGDATLLITPHGKTLLVDTGGAMGDSGFDVGERVVVPYLKHYGVTTIDYLILTHGHQDHAGGAAGVANKINVENLLLPQQEHSPAVQALLHSQYTCVIPIDTGLRLLIDNVTVTIEQSPSKQPIVSGNENSSAIRVKYGQHSFLLTGDLESHGEAELVTNRIEPCTVLKVGHHGARTSTTKPFLMAVDPKFAVISAGYGNQYNHPHPETLARLAQQQAIIFRTDTQGAIVFTSDGSQITVDTYLK